MTSMASPARHQVQGAVFIAALLLAQLAFIAFESALPHAALRFFLGSPTAVAGAVSEGISPLSAALLAL
jgi:hypothetical protein